MNKIVNGKREGYFKTFEGHLTFESFYKNGELDVLSKVTLIVRKKKLTLRCFYKDGVIFEVGDKSLTIIKRLKEII